MRALPTIEFQPQPVPNAPEAANRSGSREAGEDFATTLQRRSSSEDGSTDKKPKPTDEALKEAASEPTQPKAKSSSDEPAKDDAAAPTGETAAPVVTDKVTPEDEVMAALVAMTLPVVATTDAAPVNDIEGALLAPLTKSDGPALAAPLVAPIAATPVAALAMAADANQDADSNTTAAPTALVASTAPLALAPAATTVDATTIASTTAPVTVVNTTPVATKTGEQPVLPVNVAAPAADLPSDAALPPVTASGKPDELATTPTTTAPSLAALPATQPTAMHSVASAIGEQRKSEQPKETVTQVKSTSDALPQVNTPAPTPAATPVKPLSETVLAQNQLAQQGNAMEKSVSQQVTKAMIQNLPNGDRVMVVRLTPPELGTVKIEVVERQGVFSARLHAEDDGVRLALERFLPAMRQDLRASDAPIRELNLSDQAGFQRSFEGDAQHQQRQEANNPNQRRERDDLPRFSIDGTVREPLAVPRATPLGARVGSSWVDARA